ncbi:MAG TPA: hypothetical protein VMH39_03215 [Gemmatimonadaceae bacterium]|nr:hypothetical protein [Gemmatimonadaceae bacterium]
MKHILVRQIATSFGKGHQLPASVLKLKDGELPPQRISRDLAPRAAGSFREKRQLPLERTIEANGQG